MLKRRNAATFARLTNHKRLKIHRQPVAFRQAPKSDIEEVLPELCSQERELQAYLDEVQPADLILASRTRNIRRLLIDTLKQYVTYDTDQLDFSAKGSAQEGPIELINNISCDNIMLACVPRAVEIANGKYMKYHQLPNLIYDFFRAHGIHENIFVKALPLSLDSKKSFGVDKSVPNVRVKVSLSDIPLKKLLALLRDQSKMNFLKKERVHFYNIDIKIDVAATVTEAVRENILRRLRKELPEIHFCPEPFSHSGVVAVRSAHMRAKIYNKFAETVCSPGVLNTIGDQVFRWMKPTTAEMQKCRAHPSVLERGLSRIEVTFHRQLPTFEHITMTMKKLMRAFCTDTNYTPIHKQWEMIQPDKTVMVIDVLSRSFALSHFRQSTKFHGFLGSYKTVLNLIHRLKLCTSSSRPIELVVISSVTDQPASFDLVQKRTSVPRGGFKYKRLMLRRVGSYKKTHFIQSNGLYSSVQDKLLEKQLGLYGNPWCDPSIFKRRINSGSKILDVTLVPVGFRFVPEMRAVDPKAGLPPDGEYRFIRVCKKGGDVVLELSNGDYFLMDEQWAKWKQLFDLEESFDFHVVRGKLSLNKVILEPQCRPSNMSILPEGKRFIVSETYQRAFYNQQRTIVILQGFPNVPLVATVQLDDMLKAGIVAFETDGIGYDNARHKIRIVHAATK